MSGHILIVLAIAFIGWFGILFLLLKLPRDERELGRRFNNFAWNVAVYGTDEEFREELTHWRWKRRWKQKLFDLRRRRIEIAEYWADRRAKNLLPK